MKLIHYTHGYGGRLNYHTTCGKEIHSHSKEEGATINPILVTCSHCMNIEEYKDDYGHSTGKTITDIKRRIYLESDILSTDELHSSQREVSRLLKLKNIPYTKRVFSEILDFAWHDLEKTWEAVKNADEIYSNSSLIPLSGGSYIGAPVIFNGMCERAIKEGVTGKDVYILNNLDNIHWDMIDIPVMKTAFKYNNLFMYNDDYEMVKVDVLKISE